MVIHINKYEIDVIDLIVLIYIYFFLICRVLPTSRTVDHAPPGTSPRSLASSVAREIVIGPAVGAHAAVVGRHSCTTAHGVVRHRSGAGEVGVCSDATTRLPLPAAGPVPSASVAVILPVTAGVGQSPVSTATASGAGPLSTGAVQSVRLPRWPAPPTRVFPPQPKFAVPPHTVPPQTATCRAAVRTDRWTAHVLSRVLRAAAARTTSGADRISRTTATTNVGGHKARRPTGPPSSCATDTATTAPPTPATSSAAPAAAGRVPRAAAALLFAVWCTSGPVLLLARATTYLRGPYVPLVSVPNANVSQSKKRPYWPAYWCSQ